MSTSKTTLVLALWMGFPNVACVAETPVPAPEWYACDDVEQHEGQAHPDAARYQGLVDGGLQLGAPAVSVAVISPDGLWLGSGGQADIAQGISAKSCHKYHVASTTKMLASTAALRLVEQGQFQLDDLAAEFLPSEVIGRVANLELTGSSGVTIRQLMQHTSGIPDYLTMGYFFDAFNFGLEPGSAAEELERIYGLDPWFEPGTDFEYSNANYLLLSLIIAETTGSPSHAAVYQYVTEPLGLDSTFARSEHPMGVVRGYGDLHGNGVLMDHTELTEAVMLGEGKLDGGFVSTASDLATLVRALAKGVLLSEESTSQMQDFLTYEPGEDDGPENGYGLGLARIETAYGGAIGHYGTVYPYQTLAFHFLEQDVTVVVTTNGTVGGVGDWLNSDAPYELLFE